MNKGKQSKGIALISVLFIAAIVLILASTFIFTVVRERQSTNAARLVSDSLQMADAVSERGRLQVVGLFQDSYITANKYVKAARELLDGKTPSDPVAALESFVNNPIPVNIDNKKGWWKIVGATEFDSKTGRPKGDLYLEVAASSQTANGVQTVIRRIDMGRSQIFDLAMLSEDTTCMYCHLKVNGDVGSLGATMRPGWGAEGVRGINSGAFSNINGNVYTTGTVTSDNTNLTGDPKVINGSTVTGDVEQNSSSQKLPRNNNNEIAFPPIERETAKQGAKGSLKSAALIYTIPEGGALSASDFPLTSNQTSLAGNNNSNVVLIGTKDKPIVLEGDLYFDGDVIIKGYVKGQGAIYSGRNVYVAGNLTYDNPPPNCAVSGDPDGCARKAIEEKKDELRLGARGNVVMGDYTEKNLDGSTKPWQGLQAADYFRNEFFSDANAQTCYDKATGDELDVITKTDVVTGVTSTSLINIEGKEIASSTGATNVKCVDNQAKTAGAQDAYDYSMRPGQVQTDGSFKSWLSDGLYQEILGKETRKYDTWRYTAPGTLSTAEVAKQFAQYDLSDDSVAALASKSGKFFDLTNKDGDVVGTATWNNDNVYVTIDPAFEYATQTTRIDAFVYSNQRVAGKTFNAPFVVNGGLVAKELGILAPGIQRTWYQTNSRYTFMGDIVNQTTGVDPQLDCSDKDFVAQFLPDSPNPNNAQLLQPDSRDCSLTINYDHRLRNGGLGYNLVTANVGRTLNWRISDERKDRVGIIQ